MRLVSLKSSWGSEGGSYVSSQCEIVFQMSQGPDILLSANVIENIVAPSLLMNYDDSQFISYHPGWLQTI